MAAWTGTARMVVRRAGLYSGSAGWEPLPGQFDTLPATDLSEIILREKVSSLLLRRLWEHRPELADRLGREPRFAQVRARIETLVRHKERILDLIDQEARTLGINVWAVKGLAAQLTYPEPGMRDLGDLDLMVADVDDAIRLTAQLLALGYDFYVREWPWVKRQAEGGPIYGQFNLEHPEPERYPVIDLHFGGYSVRHCALHPLAGTKSQHGLSYYTPQQNLPLIIGNAAGDHDITTKDLNDVATAIADPGIDWSRVLRDLDEVRLLGFFRRVIDELDATPFRSLYRESGLPSLLAGVRREVPAPRASWTRQRRWAATVVHAYAVGARHSVVRSGITSMSAAHYYWGNRTVKVRARRGRPLPRVPRLTGWTCVRLVPAATLRQLKNGHDGPVQSRFLPVDGPSEPLSAELTTIHSRIGDIVRTCLGDFVPAVYQLNDPTGVISGGRRDPH